MRTFGLIGKSLTHSFSKKFFTQLFEKEGVSAEYQNFELEEISDIKDLLKTNKNIAGLNVTVPYKVEVLPYLDEISPEAKAIGAVNTIAIKDKKTIGHNTDAFGFQQSIKPFLTFHHEKALILGTGGASKAVAYVLKNLGIEVLYISRNPNENNQFGYNDINKYMLEACKLVVNCTPVGTFPKIDECPEFPFEFLTEQHLVIDLIYNPEKTIFLEKSEKNGATILNGKAMLEQQALRSYFIWSEENKDLI